MQLVGTVEKKTRTRVLDTGEFRGWLEYLIENEPGARPAPQSFLVHQEPNWNFSAHFHVEEQFQVIVGGSGTLGSHVMGSTSIHYASRESGYGPLIAGPEGLQYLTLRSVTDSGAHYLPGQKTEMRKGLLKRQAFAGPVPPLTASELAAMSGSNVQKMIEPDASGLAAWLVRLGPGVSFQTPVLPNGGGRFHVVVGGTLLDNNEALPRPACVYTVADVVTRVLQAGPGGLEIVIVQFPESALNIEPPLAKKGGDVGPSPASPQHHGH